MNIRRLPSGNYQVRYQENGIKYAFTFDHKPTEREAMLRIKEQTPKKNSLTLKEACQKYISDKSNILSASTIRGYNTHLRQLSAEISQKSVLKISKRELQSEINAFAGNHSPKTTTNYGSFLCSVLAYYDVQIGKLTYPQKIKHEGYIPTETDIKRILEAMRGHRSYVAVFLGCRGLRMSEIAALTLEDLTDDNYISINKAKVKADSGYVTKTTKTTSSTRKIYIPESVADLVRKQGYFFNNYPLVMYKDLIEIQKQLNIPHFSFHQLRHFFASYSHYKGFADKTIQDEGGWATDRTMKEIYRQSMNQKEYSKEIGNLLESLL